MTLTKRKQQAQATKEKILRNSIELITARGYDEVTISEICRVCEVAKGTFYTHFTSKRDIAIEILKDINVRLFHDLKVEPDRSARSQLEHYAELYFRTVLESGTAMSREIFHIIQSVRFTSGDVADLHSRFISDYTRLGQEQGAFRGELDADRIGQYLTEGNLALVRRWIHNEDSFDLLREGKEYMAFMLSGLEKR